MKRLKRKNTNHEIKKWALESKNESLGRIGKKQKKKKNYGGCNASNHLPSVSTPSFGVNSPTSSP